jgi:hypothetical protein
MADCECITGCGFFKDQMDRVPTVANILKQKYCYGDNSQCARYIIFCALGKDNVPRDLQPNMISRVKMILNGDTY